MVGIKCSYARMLGLSLLVAACTDDESANGPVAGSAVDATSATQAAAAGGGGQRSADGPQAGDDSHADATAGAMASDAGGTLGQNASNSDAGTAADGGGRDVDAQPNMRTDGGVGTPEAGSGNGTASDASVQDACPRDAPKKGSACRGKARCFYQGAPLSEAYECYYDRWILVMSGASPGVSGCPLDPSDAPECTDITTPACLYSTGGLCMCTTPQTCSGVTPQFEEPTWMCRSYAATPFDLSPSEGQPCPEIGLRATPFCCGAGWNCTEHGWVREAWPCPP